MHTVDTEGHSGQQLTYYWQCPDSNTSTLKYDDAALLQRGGQLRQVIEKQFALLWGPVRKAVVEKDNRRFASFTSSQQQTKVGVGSDNNTFFLTGSLKNHRVRSSLQPVLTHMNGIVARLAEHFGNERRNRVVNQKSHAVVSGNARSFTASAAYSKASRISSCSRSGWA